MGGGQGSAEIPAGYWTSSRVSLLQTGTRATSLPFPCTFAAVKVDFFGLGLRVQGLGFRVVTGRALKQPTLKICTIPSHIRQYEMIGHEPKPVLPSQVQAPIIPADAVERNFSAHKRPKP